MQGLKASTLRPRCPLWVKSRHFAHNRHVRFTPNSDIDCVLIVFKPQHRPSSARGFEPPSNQIAVRQFSTVPAASEWDHAHAFPGAGSVRLDGPARLARSSNQKLAWPLCQAKIRCAGARDQCDFVRLDFKAPAPGSQPLTVKAVPGTHGSNLTSSPWIALGRVPGRPI